jgi:hypothetical protein
MADIFMAVAASRPENTPGRTLIVTAITSVAYAVIALFLRRVHVTVPTERPARQTVRHTTAVRTVVDSIIAELISGHDAVPADGRASAFSLYKTFDRQVKIRRHRMTFRVK